METYVTLDDVLRRPAWMADAACLEHPEVNFFPDQNESVEDAKAVCARCLVRDDCLAYALATREERGVWGGLSGRERTRIRKGRAA